MLERVSRDRSGAKVDYVFGYASLVAHRERVQDGGVERAPLVSRLRGFRRTWGVAMNNWEAGEGEKHFVDSRTGLKPHVRVAYLDVREAADAVANGLALPADADRLAALDAREVNYARLDVTEAFEPVGAGGREASTVAKWRAAGPRRVFAFVGTEAARGRCQAGLTAGDTVVSRAYFELVRAAFAGLAPGALEEFDRTTEPLPFRLRDLDVVD
jgi:hypothetical protein